MVQITIDVTVEQIERLDRVLENWQIFQTEQQRLVYGANATLQQDMNLVQNIRDLLQNALTNNTE